MLNNGNIVADGTFAQLKAQCSQGSLEDIFNQLSGFSQHQSISGEFIGVIEK